MLGTSLRKVRCEWHEGGLRITTDTLTKRSQGSSYKNRMATSNVAPPQHSILKALARAWLVSFAIFAISIVLRRVANNDWCASRHVVSMISVPGYSRTALAKPSGPFSSKTLRQPVVHGAEVSRGGPLGSSLLGSFGMTTSSFSPGSPLKGEVRDCPEMSQRRELPVVL